MVNNIDWRLSGKKQNVHVCHAIFFGQAQYTVPLRKLLATGNGKCEE